MGTIAHGLSAILRRKFLLGGVFVVAALGILASLVYGSQLFSSEKIIKNEPLSKSEQKLQNIALAQAVQDSDGDGLKDWEEAIYKTDAHKADTDSDGASDSQEIKDNRDPLKKGPNDKAAAPTPLPDNAGQTGLDPTNLTQNFTAAIISSGAINAIDPNGNITSTDYLDNLQLPNSVNPENLFKDIAPVSRKDLVVANTSDPAAIREYFTAIARIYQAELGAFAESDIAIFAQAIEQQDFSSLSELDQQAKAVGRAADEIKKLAVPIHYAGDAITEIQNLRHIRRTMEVMANYEQDPLAAIFAVKKRTELIDSMARSTADVKARLEKAGILSSS